MICRRPGSAEFLSPETNMAKEASKPTATAAPKTGMKIEFSNEDALFLTWTLGFTAGANLERDGERGERIFARCRDLHNKIHNLGEHANPS